MSGLDEEGATGLPEVHPELETFTKDDLFKFTEEAPYEPVLMQWRAYRNAIIRVWYLVKSYAKTGYNPWDGTDHIGGALPLLD